MTTSSDSSVTKCETCGEARGATFFKRGHPGVEFHGEGMGHEIRPAPAPSSDPVNEEHLMSGKFHWREGISFQRIDTEADIADAIEHAILRDYHPVPVPGDVRLFIGMRDGQGFIVPEAEWASIIASVSTGGETTEKYREALRFHGGLRRFTVDGRSYETNEGALSGVQIKRMGNAELTYQLYRETADRKLEPITDAQVVEINDGKFFAIPPATGG